MGDLHKARARADAFAYAVDSGPRHSVRDADDPELATAVDLVARLREVGAVNPRPGFDAELRRRLLDQAAARAAASTPIVLHTNLDSFDDDAEETPAVTELSARRGKRLRLVAATVGLVALGGGIGSAAAAQQAIPGDTLYGFKRSIETVATNVSVGDGSRGRRELGHARTRLAEIRMLTEEGADAALISSTLRDFSSQARRGVSRLVAAYQQDGDPASIEAVHEFIGQARRELREVLPMLPDDAVVAGTEANDTIDTLARHASTACPKCAKPAAVTSQLPTPSENPTREPSTEPADLPTVSGNPTLPPLQSSSQPLQTTVIRSPGSTTTITVPLPTFSQSTSHSPDPRKPTVRPTTPGPTVRPTRFPWPFPSLQLPTLPLPPWLTMPPWRR